MDPLVQLANGLLPGEKRFVLVAGAGVSKDAGLPTAWDIMLTTAKALYVADAKGALDAEDLGAWLSASKYKDMTYAQMMETLYPKDAEQQMFLRGILGSAKPGAAHNLIAELARRNMLRAIVTTNFDECLEQAVQAAGLPVQVIANEEDLEKSEPLIHCKSIRLYKPNGTISRGKIRNSPKEIERLPRPFEEELTRVFGEHAVIVLGVSGSDPGMLKALQGRKNHLFPLFWVNRQETPKHVVAALGPDAFTPILCKGAGEFIADVLKTRDLLDRITPSQRPGTSIYDLERALDKGAGAARAAYTEFGQKVLTQLEGLRPDFKQFKDLGEALLTQVQTAKPVVEEFMRAADLAAAHGSTDGLKALYQGFEKLAPLTTDPPNVRESYHREDFGGYQCILNTMFTSMVAALVKHERWAELGVLLDRSLVAHLRNQTLTLPPAFLSWTYEFVRGVQGKTKFANGFVTPGVQQGLFEGEQWPLSWSEFAAGDAFMFVRTHVIASSAERTELWLPQSSKLLDELPTFVLRIESRRELAEFAKAVGSPAATDIQKKLPQVGEAFKKLFTPEFVDPPLASYDWRKTGSRP